MPLREAFNECYTPAAVSVSNSGNTSIVATGLAALTPAQTARLTAIIIGVETESIRLGGSDVSTTRGPVIAAGSVIELPWNGGPIFAASISGTSASVSCTFGML